MDKESFGLFFLLGILCTASLFIMGLLANVLVNGAKKPQEQRLQQLEQRCDSLQRQIDYMVVQVEPNIKI